MLLTFRRFQIKNNAGTLLGVAGLVVGLICVMFIFFWTSNEISYDRFHKNIDRIFVVHAYLDGEGAGGMQFGGCPPAVGPALKADYPEVEASCRYVGGYSPSILTIDHRHFTEHVALADFSIFDIFSFPFIYGGKGEEGANNRIVISERIAEKYFGEDNPVGKGITLDKQWEMTVVGVMANIPSQSSLEFDLVIPIDNMIQFWQQPNFLNTWWNNGFRTFGLLKQANQYDKIASTITRRIQKEVPESTNYLRSYQFKDRYLYEWDNIRKVHIYIGIGLLILLAAVLNFVNLSTARSAKQAKETGIRKTMGASRSSLIRLYYTDTAAICLFAFALAVLVTLFTLPFFNQIVGKGIEVSVLLSPIPLLALVGIALVTIVLSGAYPAIFLSSFSPLQANSKVKNGGWFRNSLVVVMFLVAIGLLSSTYTIWLQTKFLANKELGYQKEQLLYINLGGELKKQADLLKDQIQQLPEVLGASKTSFLPTMIGNNGEGWTWEGKDPNFKPLVTNTEADRDVLDVLGASMQEGSVPAEGQGGLMINETFARLIGWDSFVGKSITNGDTYTILGVLKDIQFNSLAEPVKPMMMWVDDKVEGNFLLVRLKTNNPSQLLASINKTCSAIEPMFPAECGFISDKLAEQLQGETDMTKLVGIFSIFAMVVLALGLLGMVMFLVEQRTKEIGIRKCLGEEVSSIMFRLIRPFVRLGVIAAIIAIPLSWYIMDKWLQAYENRINLDISIFLLSGGVVIMLTIVVVLWQSWRAAVANPVESIKTE